MPKTSDRSRQYVVQHESDDDPTYVVRSADKQLGDEDCVAFGGRVPVEARLRLARFVCDELNRLASCQQVHGQPSLAVQCPTANRTEGQPLITGVAAGIVPAAGASSTGIRNSATLCFSELVDFVSKIQALFYLDILGDRELWNPDKEWDGADLLDELALVLYQYGLAPSRISEASL
jgi:hypothetical protein